MHNKKTSSPDPPRPKTIRADAMSKAPKTKAAMVREALAALPPNPSHEDIFQCLEGAYPNVQVSKSTIWDQRPMEWPDTKAQHVYGSDPAEMQVSMADLQTIKALLKKYNKVSVLAAIDLVWMD
jgi:hypothetical protein